MSAIPGDRRAWKIPPNVTQRRRRPGKALYARDLRRERMRMALSVVGWA
jgi:hypothetical protein